jgi:hypothetical protein
MSPAQVVLSSRLTYFTKVIFPIVWIVGFGAATAAMWVSNGMPNQTKWAFLAVLIVGALSFWWICAPLKKVRIDGSTLYVSNYLKEIALPLDIVERITENRWVNFRPVTLYFRRFTDFGDKIVFMPKTQIMLPWRSHPVVDEIKRIVIVATAKSGKDRNTE